MNIRRTLTLLSFLTAFAHTGFSQSQQVIWTYVGGIPTMTFKDVSKSAGGQAVTTKAGQPIKLTCEDLNVNTADSTVNFSCTFKRDPAVHAAFVLRAKAANGVASLIGNGVLAPGVGGGATVGFTVKKDVTIDFSGAWSREELSFFDDAQPFAGQRIKKRLDKPEAHVVISKSISKSVNSQKVHKATLSAEFGYAKQDNYDQLDEVTIRDYAAVQSGTTIREFGNEVTSRTGPFVRSDVFTHQGGVTYEANDDYRVEAFENLSRSGHAENTAFDLNFGFFKKVNDPNSKQHGKSKYGVVAELRDITQPKATNGNLGRRFVLGIRYTVF